VGRIRTIKPEFFKHAGLFDLEQETGLPIRLAFAGLWTCCDREGRFKWRPRELKLDVLPHDSCDFSRVLDALATRGFVVKYSDGREEYACIPTWHTHQIINNRESPSGIPEPPKNKKVKARVPHASGTPLNPAQGEGKGREGKGNGKEGDATPPAPLFSFPEWVRADTWLAFEQMRKRIKKPLTDESAKRIIARLQKWRGEGQDVEEILSRSIENEWQGIWPLEETNGKGKNNGSAQGNSSIEGCKTGSAYFDGLLQPLSTTR